MLTPSLTRRTLPLPLTVTLTLSRSLTLTLNLTRVEVQASALCTGPCPAGSVCAGAATVSPSACSLGGYCPQGSPAALPCPPGRFGNSTALEASEGARGCLACPAGAACGLGATLPLPCAPGTFAPNSSTAACLPCPPTTYQPAAGASACVLCGAAHFCPEGSSMLFAPPCTEGTYLPAGRTYTEPADCAPCPLGMWCSGDSSEPRKCALGSFAPTLNLTRARALTLTRTLNLTLTLTLSLTLTLTLSLTRCALGSFANVSGLARCFDCQPGSYQDRRGATGSLVCPVGAYCAGEGASAPTPCPGGSWSNRTGLRSEHECTKVLRGEWAPLGSTQAG